MTIRISVCRHCGKDTGCPHQVEYEKGRADMIKEVEEKIERVRIQGKAEERRMWKKFIKDFGSKHGVLNYKTITISVGSYNYFLKGQLPFQERKKK